MKLTDKQKYVVYKIKTGIDSGILEQKLGGFAGTGKTTILKYLVQFFPDFAVLAFTGKAAQVARKKGIHDARTIHSLIYMPIVEHGVLVGFELVPKSELACSGFFIDEASMVSKDIYEDLKSYGLPIVYIGDHGQLEPIGTDFNIMSRPDYKLEEIHRNAGDIALFSNYLRQGGNAHGYRAQNEDKLEIIDRRYVTDYDLLNADQIICAYNKTRVGFNARMRASLGLTGPVQEGDKVICLKNNAQLGLFNGMQGTVKRVYQEDYKDLMDFEFDDVLYSGIWYDTRFFNVEKPMFDYYGTDHPNPFDFAYCITAHKAQGDEFDKVLVYEQYNNNWDHKRWAYTAASRAKEKLYWAC